jgi:hypothetical protein
MLRFSQNSQAVRLISLFLGVCAYLTLNEKSKYSRHHKVFDNLKFTENRKIDAIPDTGTYVATIHTMEQQDFEEYNQFVIMRLINIQHPFFHPEVRVGSRQDDARQLVFLDLPRPLQSPYVAPLVVTDKDDSDA